jgi:hypothetical protein
VDTFIEDTDDDCPSIPLPITIDDACGNGGIVLSPVLSMSGNLRDGRPNDPLLVSSLLLLLLLLPLLVAVAVAMVLNDVDGGIGDVGVTLLDGDPNEFEEGRLSNERNTSGEKSIITTL